jgi:hypothetical protein
MVSNQYSGNDGGPYQQFILIYYEHTGAKDHIISDNVS